MRSSHELGNALFHFRDGSHVIPEQRGKRFSVLPIRALWQKRFDSVPHKEDLEIDRLLGPERAVVVEGRDTFFGFNKIWRTFPGYSVDKINNRLLCRSIVP